jgi:DNA-binding ferritin-like protein (Dps family)
MINKEKLHVIAHRLGIAKSIDDNNNTTSEEVRLSLCFSKAETLKDILIQVLFGTLVYEDLNDEQTDEFNLYKLFFTGIGNSFFYFNESFLKNDIKESISLDDYCQRDHAYQQLATLENLPTYDIKDYHFSCDYWIRFINNKQELVYATLCSASSELYWLLEEEANEFIECYIPHKISMLEQNQTPESELIECELITDANGKEDLLDELKKGSRIIINELTSHYEKSLTDDEACVWYREDIEERGSRYSTYIANNSMAAERIILRDFEKSINELLIQGPWSTPKDIDYTLYLKQRLMLLNVSDFAFGEENKHKLLDFTHEFAKIAHQGQIRKGNGGEPYINHLTEVVSLLSNEAKVSNVQVLVAAYLHDILEETQVNPTDIQLLFGQDVLEMVDNLSDDKSLSLKQRRDQQIKHMQTVR